MTSKGFRSLTVFFAVAVLSLAQQSSQQPQPSPSPSPSPGSIPPSPSPGREPSPRDRLPSQTERDPFPSEMPRPIFLSGKVMMDDGTPPPEPVVIERVCNGNPRPEAYTDSKGHFHFQLGQQMGMMADASVSSAADPGFGDMQGGMAGMGGPMGRMGPFGSQRGITEQQLMGCEIRAALPGYRSDVISLAGRRSMDNPELGVIVLHRLANVEGTTISATSLNAPKDARKALEKGRQALKKKKLKDARKELEKAVKLYPKYAAAWFELGQVQEAENQTEQARESYSKALEADAKFINPYLALSLIAAKERKWQEVADTSDRAIKLNPFDFPQAYYFNSVANYNLGNRDAAEKSAREAQKLDTQHRFPKVTHLLGIILAERRDYGAAAEQMRNYLKFAPGAQDASMVQSQLSELEKLASQQP